MASTRTTAGSWGDDDASSPGSATIASSNTRQPTTRAPINVVRDDWEDDEDDSEDDAPTVERNKQIWEDANTKVHHAMPSVILSRNATNSTAPASIPPQGVFDQQPKMKILKRPTATSPSALQSTPTDNASAQESLREREAKYNAARERIFGSESPASSSSNVTSPKPLNPPQPPQVKLVREPRGPSGESQFGSRGFEGRNPNPKPSSTTGND